MLVGSCLGYMANASDVDPQVNHCNMLKIEYLYDALRHLNNFGRFVFSRFSKFTFFNKDLEKSHQGTHLLRVLPR